MNDHLWKESAGAYALEALAGEERLAFETHLSGCAACRAEVQSLREVAALLAHAAPAAVAPAALRDRVMAVARRAPRQTHPGRARWVPWLAAAASLVLAAAAVRQARDAGDRARALETELASRDETIGELLSPELHIVSLASTGSQPTARVFWNHQRQVFIVTAFDLPPAPAGRTYQLWAIATGQAPISMGTFNTDARGRTALVIPVQAALQGIPPAALCGLTQEPAGGSRQPTEPPRLVGTWRHAD